LRGFAFKKFPREKIFFQKTFFFSHFFRHKIEKINEEKNKEIQKIQTDFENATLMQFKSSEILTPKSFVKKKV